MPRKKLGAFRNAPESWSFKGRKSKYSPRTEKELYQFMFGYLGREEFEKFRRLSKEKKRLKEKMR